MPSLAHLIDRKVERIVRERSAPPPPDPNPPELFRVTPDPAPKFITRDGPTPVVHAHAGQWDAYTAPERFVLILAGTRGGKTAIGPWWLLKVMQRMGPGEYLCAAPTFKLLKKGIYKSLRRAFVGELRLGGIVGGAEGEFRFSPTGFAKLWPGHEYTDEAKVVFAHAANPDGLEAAEYKAAWLDEPGQRGFPVESWEAVQRRLAIDSGPCLMTTTPYVIAHWIKEQVHDPAERVTEGRGEPGDEDYRVVSFKSTMNPAFPAEEFERARRSLPEWKFGLFFEGRFTRPAGAVYDCWDQKTMVVEPFTPPREWKRVVCYDFGAPNFAAVFIAEDPGEEVCGPPLPGQSKVTTARLHAYAEYRPDEARTIATHVAAIKAIEPGPAYHVGGSFSENQWRLDFAHEGLPICRPDQPEVEVGIARGYAVIKNGKMVVHRSCPRLIADLNGYSRPVDEAGNVLEGLVDKEIWHSADAFRYGMSYICRKGSPYHFEVVTGSPPKKDPDW